MFDYKTSFSKKAVFLEKTAKNPFVGGHDRFQGRGTSGDKNQYNLFCRYRRFEYFLSNNFFEKTNVFQNKREKLLKGMSGRTIKTNITFVLGNRVSSTVFKFFSQKTPYRLT